MEKIKFKKQDYIPDILNSEGPLLSIVEAICNDSDNERLYLKANIGFKKSVYCKINETGLKLFISGRISVKEMFLLRNDEPFIIEKIDEKGDFNHQFYWYTSEFENEILNSLPFFNLSFFSTPESVRIPSPYENIIKTMGFYYINSFGEISEYKLFQNIDDK